MYIKEITNLEPGKIYAIQSKKKLSKSELDHIRLVLDQEQERLGCKFLLITRDFKFVSVPDGYEIVRKAE